MSTIRPLATIAILAALGVFLAIKINEGPPVALNDSWDEAPLAGAGEDGWPAEDAAAADEPMIEAIAPVADFGASAEAPAAPTPPALPPLPAPPPEPPAASSPSATDEELTLPDFIPQANYGGEPAGTAGASAPPDQSEPAPTSLAAAPVAEALAPPPEPTVPVASPGDRAFDAAWPAIQATLDRDELGRAHQMLSQWIDEPTLSPNKRSMVESLLSDLAGTVVYSMEHRLEPPRVVKPGETLATIAREYDVPWPLLAKINGVASAEAVEPGQTLKVIRGPFAASVDLATGEMVLRVDGRYAGKFPVRVEGVAPGDGDWRVDQKRLDPTPGDDQPVTLVGAAMDQKLVLRNDAGERVEVSATPVGPAGASGRLTVASADLADLYDILSVGSPVTIRR